SLSEKERTNLAYQLMIRKPELYHTIALGEIERINNPDRVAQFEFTLRVISPNLSERIAFFEGLKSASNRKPEPWVTEALYWLHHPLRSDFSIRFIEPSLNLLPEIQSTGDIFFPKSWLDATLWGHSSEDACIIVKQWIELNKNLTPNLRQKLLQSADMLFRVNGLK
ncbi:MAG: aminopeptidase, partial [Bacteroidales bacterium]|nr:aminopeptidase [Bacteroidales bacterium]